MQIYFVVLSFFAATLIACGRNQQQLSQTANSTSSPSSDPSSLDTSVTLNGSGGNDAALLKPGNWYAFDVADRPSCGPKSVSKDCWGAIDEEESHQTYYRCKSEREEAWRVNFDLGFYLVKVDNYPFCAKKCQPAAVKCDKGGLLGGLKCAGDGLSYAGKWVLKQTEICQGACQDAIRLGREFPFECRNLNDDPEIRDLKKKILAKYDALKKDPDYQKKSAELNTILSTKDQIAQDKIDMELAEKEFPKWADTVYNPKMKSLVAQLKEKDDKILNFFKTMNPESMPFRKLQWQFIAPLGRAFRPRLNQSPSRNS